MASSFKNSDRLAELEKWDQDSITRQCNKASDTDLERWSTNEDRRFWLEAIEAEQRRRSPSSGIDIASLIWTTRDTA